MKVLLVIDMQNDFINGSLGTPEAQAIVPKVKAKVNKYASQPNTWVIYTQDTHHEDYFDTQEGKNLPVAHCIYNTEGWEIPKSVEVPANFDRTIHIHKTKFGYSKWDAAFEALMNPNEITSIELVGLCTDICIVSNALIVKALFPEIPITVDASCCAGVTPEKHKAALETMRSCQINVINDN